ncbi:MAG: hypothetical protein IJE49_04945 [Agathobacter sp.]|nr:hypothetical protein [Agathobacter sp.]
MSKMAKKDRTKINLEKLNIYIKLMQNVQITYFMVVLYIGALIIWFLEFLNVDIVVNNLDVCIILLLVVSILGSFMLILISYFRGQEKINSLYFQVAEKSMIVDQYQRYLEIKKCIETYKNTKGEVDLETNIVVIEATTEHNQAYSVGVPILLTALTAVFFSTEEISVMSPLGAFLAFLVVILSVELVNNIPRNAFTKKVVEKIKEENLKKKS